MSDAESTRRNNSRAAILNAAEIVFAEHGFAGARVDQIAQVSGYDKKLLFRYYSDKLGLYTAVLKRTEQEAHALLATVFAPALANESTAFQEQSWRHFLTSVVHTIFDYLLSRPRFL